MRGLEIGAKMVGGDWGEVVSGNEATMGVMGDGGGVNG